MPTAHLQQQPRELPLTEQAQVGKKSRAALASRVGLAGLGLPQCSAQLRLPLGTQPLQGLPLRGWGKDTGSLPRPLGLLFTGPRGKVAEESTWGQRCGGSRTTWLWSTLLQSALAQRQVGRQGGHPASCTARPGDAQFCQAEPPARPNPYRLQDLCGQRWSLFHGVHRDGGGHLHAELLLEQALQRLQGQVLPRVGRRAVLQVGTGRR